MYDVTQSNWLLGVKTYYWSGPFLWHLCSQTGENKASSTSNIWLVLLRCCGNNIPVRFVCTAAFYIKETSSFAGQSQHTGSSARQRVADKITERCSRRRRTKMATLCLVGFSRCVYTTLIGADSAGEEGCADKQCLSTSMWSMCRTLILKLGLEGGEEKDMSWKFCKEQVVPCKRR